MWQLLNMGSALGAAFLIGSVIGAGAMIYATIRAVEFVVRLLQAL